MPYQANIPQPSDALSSSQPDLLGNFQALKVLIDINHGTFGAADEGKHKFVTFPVQSSAPVFLATENGLYNLVPTASPQTAIQELFIRKQSAAGVKDIPFTASILSTATPGALTSGWTYLPSGLILKWDSNVNATGQTTITFPAAANIPVFTVCLNVQATIADGGVGDQDSSVRVTAVDPTTFKVFGSPRTTTGNKLVVFGYIAIGY